MEWTRSAVAAVAASLAVMLTAGAARAQQAEALPALPDSVAHAVIGFYNLPTTTRIRGDGRIAAGSLVNGDVAVLAGSLDLSGHVRGHLVVINGNLRLHHGAEVDGPVTVVGGHLSGLDSATVRGPVHAYSGVLRYHSAEGGIAYAGSGRSELAAGKEFGFGRTDFVVAVQHGYNRVEGLPISLGPRVRLGHANPTLLSARLIYRTGGGLRLDPGRLGYVARIQQQMGGHGLFSVSLRAASEIVPIESIGLSGRENSLATFFLHRDYRDEYEREGITLGLHAVPMRASTFSVLFRAEHDDNVQPASPWALFDNSRKWRPEPVVAQGPLRSVALEYTLDTRNETEAPSSGWYIRAEAEAGLGTRLHVPVSFDSTGTPVALSTAANGSFRAGFLDLRRYARLNSRARLATRILAMGSLNGATLPPQRQHVLGGEGTLPAYGLMSFDCSARLQTVQVDGKTSYPYYGCDRSVLVQLEYENGIDLGSRLQRFFGASVDLSHAASWVVFFDAGRAWTVAAARQGRGGGQADFAADAGVGLRFGRLGAYWAVPLTGSGQAPNFFLRIDPRF